MKVLGIDEAGRGCVFGDLVVAGYAIEDVPDDCLREAGAADSKTMSRAKRLTARARLTELGRADVRRITPEAIDHNNLNVLEESAILQLVKEHRPDWVFIDALGHPNTLPALRQRLQRGLPRGLRPRWCIEPKADGTYPVVGAASIFAKTHRDEALDELAESFGELGSGYPGDPKTKRWLESWSLTGAPWPSFVRTRWATVTALSQLSMS